MRRTTINLSEATDRQIEYLQERGFGSFTQIVRLAVDRMHREEAIKMKGGGEMANSYGFDGNIPADALYGVYDSENGEWTGHFFNDRKDAQKTADELENDPRLGVVSVTEYDDWL